jgi:predicted transport protein
MSIFKINNQKLELIKEKKIVLEKDIQRLTEQNLETIFGYKFIKSEVIVDKFRFDTLAWNPESKSFIIIEYKKDRNFSIVDQGFSYLSLLVNKKEFFLYEYFEKTKKNLSRSEVDWSQSRVVFISPVFTPHQINSINFKNMAFDLYEVKVLENNTILYNPIKPADSGESINLLIGDSKIETITKEIKNYSVDGMFKPGWDKSRQVFDILNETILALDPNIKQSPVKYYTGYKIGQKIVVLIRANKASLSIQFPRSLPDVFKDPDKLVKEIPNSVKYYNQHISYYEQSNNEDTDYAVMLIKQAYARFVKEFSS